MCSSNGDVTFQTDVAPLFPRVLCKDATKTPSCVFKTPKAVTSLWKVDVKFEQMVENYYIKWSKLFNNTLHHRRTWTVFSILYNGPLLPPQNCPFPWGSGPHLIHGSFGPPESTTQRASRSVQPFRSAHNRDRQTTQHR